MQNFNNNKSAIARYNAVIDEASQKAVTIVNTYAKPKYIAAIIEIIISAMAIVGIQVVTMGFDFSKLTSWQFWIKTLALTACIFLLFRAVVNARFEKTEKRQNVVDVMNEYKDLCKNKDLDLKDYLEEFNLNTKINVYVGKINRRINRLERKKIKTYNANKKMALTAKINTLKQEITKERIAEIINIIHVKYYMVFYDDFENIEKIGGNGAILTRGYQAYNKSFNKASFNKIWAYILCSAILALSIWTFGDTSTITIIANVLSSMVMIVTRVLTALVEADRIYDSTITASYVCKIDILKQYQQWKKEIKESKNNIIIKVEEQSEIKPILLGTQPIKIIDKDVV